MKSTVVACAAQLNLSREDRRAHGHHGDSALLYSRNDTHASLRIQKQVCAGIAQGFRPESSMARGAQAPLPEPAFLVSAQQPSDQLPVMDLQAGPWAFFTSRHEVLQAEHLPEELDPPSNAPLSPEQESEGTAAASDSEAEAVRCWAAPASDERRRKPCTSRHELVGL